ncbi:hypothetical protein F5Y18DRAFT_395112 [Xylariaceae sp. FL1019]|nr:hypothetical protein F5Y18DRAFT_395112 [Xylariaceae sp. FL1019]
MNLLTTLFFSCLASASPYVAKPVSHGVSVPRDHPNGDCNEATDGFYCAGLFTYEGREYKADIIQCTGQKEYFISSCEDSHERCALQPDGQPHVSKPRSLSCAPLGTSGIGFLFRWSKCYWSS